MSSPHVKEVSDSEFSSAVLQSATPTVVDFWAEWCAPCRAMAPIFEQLASQFAGKVNFAKVNIDHNPATPQHYGVRGIPTLVVFKGGKPVETLVGLLPKDKIEATLNRVLG